MVGDLHKLTATEARALLLKGTITSEDLIRSCLSRIEAREPDVAAWEYLDPALAIRQAQACDRLPTSARTTRQLHGIPVGIKDICDTADMPTCYGSRARLGHRPEDVEIALDIDRYDFAIRVHCEDGRPVARMERPA